MTFTGFPPEALTFYAQLEENNTKAFWEAHRDVYEDAVREPLELLVAELTREFGTAKVFRPYRDVRFSKDKTPYKTAQGALFTDDGARASRYVEISAKGLRTGGGRYHLEPDELRKVRRAIDDPVHGKRLQAIRETLEQQDHMHYVAPELKTAPRGYPKDHERIDLLRCKRHAALALHGPAPWLHTPEAKDRIVADWRAVTPLIDWLGQHAA